MKPSVTLPIGLFLISVLVFSLPLGGQEMPLPENPLEGRFIFEQKGCINCHAIQGAGGSIGPDLAKRKFYGSFLQLASVMWNHSPEMLRRMRELDLPFPEFSRTEMRELIAYLYYLRFLGEPGNLYRGRILVNEKGCLNCHSIGGKGERLAPPFDQLARYISPLYMAQALWNHGPAMDQEIRKRGLSRPTFERGEIVDLSAYIRSASRGVQRDQFYMSPGNPRRGAQVIHRKGCLDCHSPDSSSPGVGPDFQSLEWDYSVTEIAGLMWNHGSEMGRLMLERNMEWPRFSGTEMADLISYLYFLHFEDPPGDPASGYATFSKKGCKNCHRQKDEDAGAGPNLADIEFPPSAADMARVMWNHAPVMEEKAAEKIINWPNLTGQEMTDLFAYLQSRTKNTGQEKPKMDP